MRREKVNKLHNEIFGSRYTDALYSSDLKKKKRKRLEGTGTDTELICRRKPTPISHKTVICCKVESEC